MKNKIAVGLAIIIVAFALIRVSGLGLPYHQDEWKAVRSSEMGAVEAGNLFAHPPLTALSFRADLALFGSNNMRLFPLILATFSVVLLYIVVKKRSDSETALITSGLFAICTYEVLASLMIDTDGAILPFIFLVAVYFYDYARRESGRRMYVYSTLTILALLVGMMVKLSFILVIGALILDLLIEYRSRISRKHIYYALVIIFGGLILAVLAFFTIRFVYPAFRLDSMIEHARSFAHISNRNYIQVVVEGLKSLLYLSPLLLVPVIFINKKILKDFRIFGLYLILGWIFYFIIFDFSRGALDKYLMFMIVPFCILAGASIRNVWKSDSNRLSWPNYLSAVLIAGLLFSVQFLYHIVPSLYPKTLWFSRVIHLNWLMLMPFNGGSGPIGFYVSFLFIALCFIVPVLIGVFAIWKPNYRKISLVIIIAIGLVYNGVMIEELLVGKINGSAPKILADSMTYIKNHPEIKKVITYNDTGAYELDHLGLYSGRFYTDPILADVHAQTFSKFDGQYLIVNVPRIDPESYYGKFFSGCNILFESTSSRMVADVYDCGKISK